MALILGPALWAAASVAWMADAVELRAILTFWAVVFTGVGLHGVILRRLAEPAAFVHAVLGLTLAAGLAAGAGFAVELAMTETFGIDRLVDAGQASSVLTLQLPGLLYPLSLIGIGVASWRKNTMPGMSGVLVALAGLIFPISRIGEVAGVALASDLLLVVATAPVAVGVVRGDARTPSPVAQPAVG